MILYCMLALLSLPRAQKSLLEEKQEKVSAPLTQEDRRPNTLNHPNRLTRLPVLLKMMPITKGAPVRPTSIPGARPQSTFLLTTML